ncbi:peptidase M23 [Seongchinamella sediminis]|uniref:Peptidase M23 n=2 Tax=Seongchinamella sediminis TaxID=2283635 RepID=A0A3L7DV91_9GAMM|nr:peptidase M23 [Seongchinamella sediminis]
MAAAAVAGCLAIAFGLSSGDNTQPEAPQPVKPAVLADSIAPAPEPPVAPIAAAPEPPPELPWNEQVVRSGDNLSLIFKRAGYNDRHVHRVVTESEHGDGLAHIYPGQTIAFQSDDQGELVAVRHVKDKLETVDYMLADGSFSSQLLTREPELRESSATGVITSSLFMAGQEAGLSHTTIMDMANIFGGVIDFVGDPRKGDTMHLMFEELYLDGEKFADGEIIAASYNNQGKTFTAYRYTDSNGETGYYNEDGVSMRKAFLLAPVDFTRISSNFNPRRIHPIYKTARPHRGTDYAAPTGTPVYAAGDGRVIKAGYSRANGNYVFIQHGEQFVTRYLHLHKRRVKQGQRVAQSQVIGTVGSTGAATGPHLHYEFLMNGVHRNPRTIHKQLPKAKSLAASELPRFRQAIAGVSAQLAALQQETDTRLALADAGEDRG